jgi:hypothetical protein
MADRRLQPRCRLGLAPLDRVAASNIAADGALAGQTARYLPRDEFGLALVAVTG